MRADVDSIMEMRGLENEITPVKLEVTTLVALFTTSTAMPEPRERAKRHYSSRTIDGYDAHARKKKRMDLEAARRDSLIDDETR